MTVAPPQPHVFHGKLAPVAAVHDLAVGVTERDLRLLRGFDFKPDGSGFSRLVQRVKRLARAYVTLAARFDVSRQPQPRHEQTRIPIPAVAERRLARLARFVASALRSALGFRVRVNNRLQFVAGRGFFGNIDGDGRIHALARAQRFAVKPYLVGVVNALGDEENPLAALSRKLERGLVAPLRVLGLFQLAQRTAAL